MSDGLAPLMFVAAFALIFSGYPVAFALGGTALLFAAIGVQLGVLDWALLFALPERIFGIMSNYVLLAVPFFIFMGTMLEKAKLAEDLLRTIGKVFGPLRGGLALAVVFVGALLAAATGVVGATVVTMGLISLPVMLRYGYSPQLATGVISASGTLGQIIPPSVVLVVLADQLGISVGDLFVGSLMPGLMLAGMYAAYVAVVAYVRPDDAPALPPEERASSTSELLRQVALGMVPPLVLILLVLGGWSLVAEPILARHDLYRQQIEETEALLARYRSVIGTEAALKRELALLEETATASGGLLEADSPNLGAADIQTQIKAFVDGSGASLKGHSSTFLERTPRHPIR